MRARATRRDAHKGKESARLGSVRTAILSWIAIVVVVVLSASAIPAQAQLQPQAQAPSEKLHITGQQASTWSEGSVSVIQVSGPVTIELDGTKMSADNLVVWLSPEPG